MAYLKTQYRKYADGGAVEAPAELDPSVALKGQIEALKSSERAALERSIALEEQRQRPVEPQDEFETMLANSGLPPLAQTWLRANPEFVRDSGRNAKIQATHWELVDGGFEPYGPAYFRAIEDRLLKPPASGDVDTDAVAKVLAEARKSSPADDEEIFRGENSRLRITSAPVSRSVPQSNGSRYYSDDPRSIDLSPADKEHARVAGVDLKTYARGKLELARRKAAGEIQ
jgi:hypothetical protein